MTGGTKYILIFILAMFITDVSAQNNQILYNMNLPQNHMINPALRPSNSLYIGLPAISGTRVNVDNNFINFSDVFIKSQSSDSIISIFNPDFNTDKFLAGIGEKNSLEAQVTTQLLGVGFSAGKDIYIFLDINERVMENIVIPRDLIELGFKGNEGFVGNKIDLTSLKADIKYYREVGLGFSKNFTGKLRLGVKAKLLSGITGATIDNRSLVLTVNDDYSQTLDADLTVNISGPLKVYMDNNQIIDSIAFDDSQFKTGKGVFNFISGKKNLGMGLDIGATYDISDNLMVSAAITDIGFIRWKRDVLNLKAESRVAYSGLNLLEIYDGTKTFEELGNEFIDSLKNTFLGSDLNTSFTTWLPFGLTLGGSYKLNDYFSVGLLSYSRIIDQQFRQSLSLSGNVNLNDIFSASLSYTLANQRYDNFGAGLAFRAGVFQFYFLSDRIPVRWKKAIVDGNPVALPTIWNTVNFHLGMNLVFGNNNKKKTDKPMVLVE